ncbi:MAG: hypothetical protein WCP14_04685 [bacterium]
MIEGILPPHNQEQEAFHEKSRGDRTPAVEITSDGGKRLVTRVIRPRVESVKSTKTTPEIVKKQVLAQEALIEELSGTDQRVSYPDYRRDIYDYKELMPEIGSPESIDVELVGPKLVIANVRHLEHDNNGVALETQEAYRERASHLIEDLDITPNTLIFIVASRATTYIGGSEGEPTSRVSRTESTIDVIKQLLDERGLKYKDRDFDDIDPETGHDAVTGRFRNSLDEFQISDSVTYKKASTQAIANRAAEKEGSPRPYPNSPSVSPTVFASFAVDLQELESKTAMNEVASATVARGLDGFDALEEYFLIEGNIPKGVDKVVIIAGRHGQFATNISEALFVATDHRHPIAFATNGAFALVEASLTTEGEIVEDYIIKTGDVTGMREQ